MQSYFIYKQNGGLWDRNLDCFFFKNFKNSWLGIMLMYRIYWSSHSIVCLRLSINQNVTHKIGVFVAESYSTWKKSHGILRRLDSSVVFWSTLTVMTSGIPHMRWKSETKAWSRGWYAERDCLSLALQLFGFNWIVRPKLLLLPGLR